MTCSGDYTELHCCASGFTKIVWYEQLTDQHDWSVFEAMDKRRYVVPNTHYTLPTDSFVESSYVHMTQFPTRLYRWIQCTWRYVTCVDRYVDEGTDNQTLVFRQPSLVFDSHKYKCVVSNDVTHEPPQALEICLKVFGWCFIVCVQRKLMYMWFPYSYRNIFANVTSQSHDSV